MPDCNDTRKITVHHIIPRAFAYYELNLPLKKINSILNGISICRNCHNWIHDGFKYGRDKIYWHDKYDDYFRQTARKNTFQFITKEANKRRVFKNFDSIEAINAEIIEIPAQ